MQLDSRRVPTGKIDECFGRVRLRAVYDGTRREIQTGVHGEVGSHLTTVVWRRSADDWRLASVVDWCNRRVVLA